MMSWLEMGCDMVAVADSSDFWEVAIDGLAYAKSVVGGIAG
jgi:hypothetical protein